MGNEQIKDVRSLIITDYRDRFCGLVDAVSFSNMVEEYILVPQGIVKLDYDDISALLRGNMEIDAIVVEVGQKGKRLQWEKAVGKMENEENHEGKVLRYFVQIVKNSDKGTENSLQKKMKDNEDVFWCYSLKEGKRINL